MLVEKTRRIKVGNPLERDVWMGPVINEAAVKTYLSAVDRAKKDGGKILVGGRRITEPPFDRGYFVEPTIIDGLAARACAVFRRAVRAHHGRSPK